MIFGSTEEYARIDMVILLDGSDSTGAASFAKAKTFIKNFIKKYTFSNDRSRLDGWTVLHIWIEIWIDWKLFESLFYNIKTLKLLCIGISMAE